MDLILRSIVLYGFLLFVMRVAGKRSMGQMTPFNFILLLVVAQASQQALLGNDFSLATALIVTVTLVGLDIILSIIKQHFGVVSKWIEGTPLVIVDHGKPIEQHMKKSHLDDSDIMEAARRTQGLERMDQIKYAVLEKSGGITIVPR